MADLKGSSDVPAAPSGGSDAALRAALERLVLLECRVGTVPGPSADATDLELARWRDMAQRSEARIAAVEAQRDRLFARLLDAERLHTGLAGDSSEVDLASFIADLRNELSRAEQARASAERERSELAAQIREHARAPSPADSPDAWAARFATRGLIPVPGVSLLALEDLVAGSAAERALLQGVLRDLANAEAPLRELAAERLSALPPTLAAPVFAAALTRETEPAVLSKLVRGAGLTRVGSIGPLLAPLKDHEDARVRAAVLFAEVRLSPAAPAEAWLSDPDPRVRRRAALAAALHAPQSALPVLETLAGDENAGVRDAAAAGASSIVPRPDALLLRLVQDESLRVRRTALRALGAPEALADMTAADRRRALREHLRAPAEPKAAVPEAIAAPSPKASPRIPIDLDAVEFEVRSSLRGKTTEQLAQALSITDVDALSEAMTAASDRFLLRGRKWFVQ